MCLLSCWINLRALGDHVPHLASPKARSSGEVTHTIVVPLALMAIGFALTPFDIVLEMKMLLVEVSTLGISHSYLSLTMHPGFMLSICFLFTLSTLKAR